MRVCVCLCSFLGPFGGAKEGGDGAEGCRRLKRVMDGENGKRREMKNVAGKGNDLKISKYRSYILLNNIVTL